jgi:DNA-binding response OmpR family regulator
MMPGMSGIDTCREIRRRHSVVPILFLSAKSQESDKTIGLLSGGDDYLAKPFSYAELTARVKALLRRYRQYQGRDGEDFAAEDSCVVRGDFKLDLTAGTVTIGTRRIDLTDTEYGILALLAERPGTVHSARQIYESVWGEPYDHAVNGTLMVHISRLRNKIERDPKNPLLIRTVWGRGYRFE